MIDEINNPLAGIIQNVQVINNRVKGDLPKNRKIAKECGAALDTIRDYMNRRGLIEMLDSVMESGRRAAQVVDNMLSFSRMSDMKLIPHDLGELLDKTIDLASSDYDLKKKYDFREIEIIREYDSHMKMVPCDSGKIQQVLLNILKNGAQSMAENLKEEGKKRTPSRFSLRIKPQGNMAHIEIEDNGPGMDENTRKRVFDPFFTTKEVGTGTGLGLSVSFFIITQNHGGMMAVESTPGKGTKFIIQLPMEI